MYVTKGKISAQSDSPECFALISKWIEECDSEHLRCVTPGAGRPPTRLLEIFGQDDLSIRLVRPVRDVVRYIALSYCWGQGDQIPPKLCRKNRNKYKSGVTVASLPRTFQDAIYIAKRLNCQYIWIDCLCIVQDSNRDKRVEVAAMKQVYQNSFLTIAAADAESCHSGICNPRTNHDVHRTKIVWENTQSHSQNAVYLKVEPGLALHDLPDFETLYAEHQSGLLSRRAWTLQERILSPRVLHYTDRQLVWECCSKTCWEGRLDEEENHFRRSRHNAITIATKAIPAALRDHAVKKKSIYTMWYHLLIEYSKRQMTFDSDKILAISGISDLMAERLNSGFRYGIWENDLHRGSMWCAYRDDQITSGVTSFSFPTWSWAKVRGEVGFQWLGSDKHGNETLSMPNTSTTNIYFLDRKFKALKIDGLCHITQIDSANIKRSTAESWPINFGDRNHEGGVLFCDNVDDLPRSFPSAVLLCVEIGCWEQRFYGVDKIIVAGLVLKEIARKTYQRVGVFRYPQSATNALKEGWERDCVIVE